MLVKRKKKLAVDMEVSGAYPPGHGHPHQILTRVEYGVQHRQTEILNQMPTHYQVVAEKG